MVALGNTTMFLFCHFKIKNSEWMQQIASNKYNIAKYLPINIFIEFPKDIKNVHFELLNITEDITLRDECMKILIDKFFYVLYLKKIAYFNLIRFIFH